MDKALQNRLRQRHPALLPVREAGKPECLITCGNGWYDLVDRTASHLAAKTDATIALVEVKEKFGALRIRWRATTPMTDHQQRTIRSIINGRNMPA